MESDNNIYALIDALAQIKDYRKKRGVRYKLCDLLLLVIYAVLAGQTEGIDMEYYVELKFEYFNKLIGLKRCPSHDTFSRVIRYTDFDRLSNILNEWLDCYYPELVKKYGKYKILHVDGKAIRAANEKANGEKQIYLLNAMYEGGSVRVYSRRIGEKENEISQLPAFLNTFNLENTIVTIDAMGNNNTVIKSIIDNKGDYLTTVKENQGNLYGAIREECLRLEQTKAADEKTGEISSEFDNLDSYSVTEKDHGRIDTYKVTMLPGTKFIYDRFKTISFYGTIGRVGIIDKLTEIKEKGEWIVGSVTRTYIITSLETIKAKTLLEIKRSHWNIEMQHWLLDVYYNEDRSTARRGDSVSNLSAIKRFAMRIKKQKEMFSKLSLNRFFMYCNNDPENISKLLFSEPLL